MFDQKGLMAAMLPSMFKAYSATGSNKSASNRGSSLSSSNFNVSSLENQLVDISINTKMTAKNTMVMPMMARDVNITKLNIMKLVKLQGGKASKKSDMFWKDSAAREKDYESKFSKEKTKTSSSSGGSPAASGGAGGLKGIGLDFLSSLAGGIGKGVGIAAIGVGIGGFFAGLAAGGAAVTALGGAKGVKDMLVNLAEGLGAFSIGSFAAFGALLTAGALFGQAGAGKSGKALIGITAIGIGIGGFFAGLAAGGSLTEMMGGSAGVKDMMVNLAEGLNAFEPNSMIAFGALLAAGALFGQAPAIAGKAALGMTVIGAGIGGFFVALATGANLVEKLGGSAGVKDMMVNLAEGLDAFSVLDAGNLAKLALAIPAFGIGLLGFFGLEGIAGIVNKFTTGIQGVMDWIFGNSKTDKTPMQQLAEDLKLFENINGDNLSKVGQGFKDLASGLLGFAKITPEDLEKAVTAAGVTARLNKVIGGNQTTAPAKTGGNMTPEQIAALQADPYAEKKSTTSSPSSPTKKGGMSSSRLFNKTEPSTTPSKDTSTQTNTGPDGKFKSQKDFLQEMYPLAVEASKQLGGVDPNALLTQWGFESAWGSKTSGKYNYFGIKADDSWKGPKEDVMTHEYINGKKVDMLQPFRSYANPKEAVADYVNFLKNNKRYKKAGVFETKTSGEYFGALQKAGYATDPNYAAKLTSATEGTARKTASMQPSTSSSGTVLASTSTSVADQKLALMSGSNGTTNINAPTTNNNAGGGSNNSNGNIKLYNDALRNTQLSMLI
jgi:flagellum-specific peptidoglycan hydrolase FlgJ